MSKRIFFSYRRAKFVEAQLLLAWVKEEPGPYITFIDVFCPKTRKVSFRLWSTDDSECLLTLCTTALEDEPLW